MYPAEVITPARGIIGGENVSFCRCKNLALLIEIVYLCVFRMRYKAVGPF